MLYNYVFIQHNRRQIMSWQHQLLTDASFLPKTEREELPFDSANEIAGYKEYQWNVHGFRSYMSFIGCDNKGGNIYKIKLVPDARQIEKIANGDVTRYPTFVKEVNNV